MAVNVLKLKKQAVELGMEKREAMKANREALEDFIASASKPSAKKKAVAKKTVAKKKTATKKTTTKKTARKPERKATVSKPKKTAARKSAPAAKSTKSEGKAKRRSSTDGRHLIGTVDFTKDKNWNPREGSAVEIIFKALKKAKGDVDKAVALLLPRINELTSAKKPDGTKRTKAEREELLRYRVNRTKFEFARRTGQHKSSENRVEYGTGDYASAKKKTKRTPKASTKKPVRKPAKTTGAKRGRPKGSKNTPKATTKKRTTKRK